MVRYQTMRVQAGSEDAKLIKPILQCDQCTGQDPVTKEFCTGVEVSPQYIKLTVKDLAKLGVEMLPQEKSMRSTVYKVVAISITVLVILGAILLAVILI